MITIISWLLILVLSLILFAEVTERINQRLWKKYPYRAVTWAKWLFWNKNIQNYNLFVDLHSISIRLKHFTLAFRWSVFVLNCWVPRKYWDHWVWLPMCLRLRSFCGPWDHWEGAKWRILYGPIDFVWHRLPHERQRVRNPWLCFG